MPLQLGRGLGHVDRSDHPTDTPAGHGIRFGHAVEYQQLATHFGHCSADIRGFCAIVVEMLVDFVGNHPHMMFHSPFTNRLDGFRLPHGTRRIVRRVHDDGFRTFGTRFFEIFKTWFEIAVGTGEHFDRHASGQFHRFRIARPIRRRNDDFVAFIKQDLECRVHGLLAAVGYDNLVRIDFVTGIAQRFFCDCLAQFRQTCRWSVTIVLRILHRFGRSCDDRSRSREVRLARAKSNDVDSFSFHRFRFGINGQSSARSHAVNTFGKSLPISHSHACHANPPARKTTTFWHILVAFAVPFSFLWLVSGRDWKINISTPKRGCRDGLGGVRILRRGNA